MGCAQCSKSQRGSASPHMDRPARPEQRLQCGGSSINCAAEQGRYELLVRSSATRAASRISPIEFIRGCLPSQVGGPLQNV